MKSGFLDKLIDRVDRVETGEVQNYLIQLSREKGFLEQVFEALQEGVIILNSEGKITYLNSAARRIFGVPEGASAIGKPLEKTVLGLRWDSFANSLQPGRVLSRDLEIFYPENRFLNFYLSPVGDAEDSDGAFVMLIRDITHSRRATEKKIESERLNALTLLAAGVAHELGNPLNSLTIHLQLIRRKLGKTQIDEQLSKELTTMLEVAENEISRLDSIIKQFLGAIRPSQPELAAARINDIIQESARVLTPELENRKIALVLELDPLIPEMPLDTDQMKQAFFNLIRNASQAMGAEGTLTIRSESDNQETRISFIDRGSGMSPEDLGAAFEPYHTTKGAGTGLGLLIVRRIIREHGGEIEIESEKGIGTEVTIHLPRVDKRMRFLETSSETIPAETKPNHGREATT